MFRALTICCLALLPVASQENASHLKTLQQDEATAILDFTHRHADGTQLVGGSGHHLVSDSDGPSRWSFEHGVLTASPAWDSLLTPKSYQDFRMHIEFNINSATNDNREANGNSGVYIQQRYEVQILDSNGISIDAYQKFDCGSLYRFKKPDRLACRPAGSWQSFDIVFRAARFDAQDKVENARITVFQNDQLIHNDVALTQKTGAGQAEGPDARPIKLQGHHNEVRFRNVWIQALTLDAMPLVPRDDARRANKTLPRPGEVFSVDGHTAFVIEPSSLEQRKGPRPWVWYAPTLSGLPSDAESWMFERFLHAGIAIAGVDVGESYGSPAGTIAYQALYERLTRSRGYAAKPVLLARSRGGLMLYNWAIEHPNCVAGVAGIYPVCDIASYPGLQIAAPSFGMSARELQEELPHHNPIERLAPLALARVPILHLHGDQDGTVPLDANSGMLATRYREGGGSAEVVVFAGRGHDMWSGWFQSEQLTAFAIRCALTGAGVESATK
ncbi:MAG: hypothetical protein ACI835_004250 [Planctomycetota bacterium]|jgi:hypothetical protein